MNPALLLALITEIGIPELKAWLRSRSSAGQNVTDADIIAKLATDTDFGIRIGEHWLADHPQ